MDEPQRPARQLRTRPEPQASEERLRDALEAGGIGVWEWDLGSGRVAWSETLERLHGLAPGSFEGTFDASVRDAHPEDREHLLHAIEKAVQDLDAYAVEYRAIRPDGAVRWLESRGRVRVGPDGSPIGMSGTCADVTERREAERGRARLLQQEKETRAGAEAAKERLGFLAEASKILASSLELEHTMERLADLAVPRLADWCSIELFEDGRIRSLGMAHVDPSKTALARELRRRYPPDPGASSGVAGVLRTGRAELHPEITDEILASLAEDPEHRRILRSLGVGSTMIVPLIARGRTLGAIVLVSGESGRRFDDADLALAEDLAGRAALAIDNARLFEERSRIAHTLQQSLLPPALPEISGLDVVARYQPAGRDAEVGGDFYDLFQRAEDDWVLVVGDVCGKGPDAAALTGLARHTLRAAGMTDPMPDRVLERLNEAILKEGADRFSTVAYGRLVRKGERFALTVACGGHPPVYVLRRDGVVETVGPHGTLLGVFDDPEIESESVRLEPGDVAVFYTDGLFEGRRIGVGPATPTEASLIQRCAFLESAAAVADRLEEQVRGTDPAEHRDDMALVILRVIP